MKIELNDEWKSLLTDEFKKDYFKKLAKFLTLEYKTEIIYPPADLIFNALNKTPFSQVKVVIVGQDPYHGQNQAHGLSFSVQKGIATPPSLQNIYKEMKTDVNKEIPENGDLTYLTEQGVLLLNSVLTVRKSQPASHANVGWELFTDKIIEIIANRKNNVVFMLWGAYAQDKLDKLNHEILKKHHILTTTHPSPFSANRGFFGCKHFSSANNYLIQQNITPINW